MEKLKMNAYYPAVLVCLVILVIAGWFFVYHAYLLPGDLRQNQSQDSQLTLQPTPVIPAPAQPECSGYLIDEVQPDSFMPNGTIVQLTPDELADFPEIEKVLQSAVMLPAGDRYGPKIIDWYNGHRYVGGFTDQNQYYEFRNLSCKHSPGPKCDPLNTSQEFKYTGRYYEVLCYPGFAGAHQNLPPMK
jgi:hypothetical protein